MVQDTTLAAPDIFLRANSEGYGWLVERAQVWSPTKHSEAMLSAVSSAAYFAATFHPGRFADGSIENLALRLGERLGELGAEPEGIKLPVFRSKCRRRVLHIASNVFSIGGLTQMLYRWVRNDQSSCHSLIVTQGDFPVPERVADAVGRSGGGTVKFPKALHLCQKAIWLRRARRIADLIVLHHDSWDVTPTVAFAVQDCAPVTVLNHADHLFWLGSSISDMVINLRKAGSEHTAMRRFVSSNAVLPIPLADTSGQASRREARDALGISGDQVVLLSVGRAEKYRPCGSYDFVSTANKILDRQCGTHIYVVGESTAGIAPYLRHRVHDRLHFVGSIPDPSLYRSAADVYLESFPFGSQTALLEAALSGLPVVPAYAPLFPLLVANDDSVQELLPNPSSEEEYIDKIDFLIKNVDERAALGQTLRGRLLADHVGGGWLHRLAEVYAEADRLAHCPRAIPASSCAITDADIGLSLWNVKADGRWISRNTNGNPIIASLRHKVFLAKYVGNFAAARRYAWRAVMADPSQPTSWRLLAVALLGRAGRFIGQNFLPLLRMIGRA